MLTRHSVRSQAEDDWDEHVSLFSAYLRLIKQIASELSLQDPPTGYLQAALGIYADPTSGAGLCVVVQASPLLAFASTIAQPSSERVILSWSQIRPQVLALFRKRVQTRSSALYGSIRLSPQLRSPCASFFRHGVCKSTPQCNDQHLCKAEYGQAEFHTRVQNVVDLFNVLRDAKMLYWALRSEIGQGDISYDLLSKQPRLVVNSDIMA